MNRYRVLTIHEWFNAVFSRRRRFKRALRLWKYFQLTNAAKVEVIWGMHELNNLESYIAKVYDGRGCARLLPRLWSSSGEIRGQSQGSQGFLTNPSVPAMVLRMYVPQIRRRGFFTWLLRRRIIYTRNSGGICWNLLNKDAALWMAMQLVTHIVAKIGEGLE